MSKIASLIDHTLLAPSATPRQIVQLCEEAHDSGFAAVCVNPFHVPLCARELRQSNVLVATVVGFPLGANCTSIKVAETKLAVQEGADEIDMVINIGALKGHATDYVLNDIRGVVRAAGRAAVKVIIETELLTRDEIIRAAQLCVGAKAAMVKTCTGFAQGGGATVEDVLLIQRTIAGSGLGIKASKGIGKLDLALRLIEAGATRLGVGTPKGQAMLSEESAAS